MSPVDPPERLVIDGLDAVFHFDDESPGLDIGKELEFVRVDAVWSRPHHKTANAGEGECLFIAAGEGVKVSVRIGEGLEVGKVAVRLAGALPVEGNPGFQLPGNAFPVGVPRVEGVVVAEGAAAGSGQVNPPSTVSRWRRIP